MVIVKIFSNIELAPMVHLLEFEKPFNFRAGQVITIHTHDIPPRIYSITSGENEPTLKILFDVKPYGQLTPKLCKLRINDTLQISEPFGSFSSNHTPAYWIAVGTGIAPFYSMFLSGLAKDTVLIHGAKNAKNLYFSNELKKGLAKDHYVNCLSREKSDADFHGRVTEFLNQSQGLPTNLNYYICGSAEMVVDTRDALISKGIRFENIIAEIYF